MSSVVETIFQLLKAQDKSQVELADYLGLSTTTISGWGKGITHSPYSYIEGIKKK